MKVLYFSDGKKAEVTGENGKFYLTKKAQFRKGNPDIVDVKEEPDKKKAEKAESKKDEEKESPKASAEGSSEDKKDGDA